MSGAPCRIRASEGCRQSRRVARSRRAAPRYRVPPGSAAVTRWPSTTTRGSRRRLFDHVQEQLGLLVDRLAHDRRHLDPFVHEVGIELRDAPFLGRRRGVVENPLVRFAIPGARLREVRGPIGFRRGVAAFLCRLPRSDRRSPVRPICSASSSRVAACAVSSDAPSGFVGAMRSASRISTFPSCSSTRSGTLLLGPSNQAAPVAVDRFRIATELGEGRPEGGVHLRPLPVAAQVAEIVAELVGERLLRERELLERRHADGSRERFDRLHPPGSAPAC